MHHQLEVRLLGAFSIQHNHQPIVLSNAARLVLAYLLLQRHCPQPRLLLASRLWPNRPESSARHMLSQALWQLRNSLPIADLICTTGDTFHIPTQAAIWVDVSAFDQYLAPLRQNGLHTLAQSPSHAAIAHLYRAIDLYRGDLLEGWYDDWVEEARDQLRQRYRHAVNQLMIFNKAQANYQEALNLALALTRIDPFDETMHCEVMRLLVSLDRSHEALRHFDTYRRMLEREMGIEPDETTFALAQAIDRRAHAPGDPYVPPRNLRPQPMLTASSDNLRLPLIGRDNERAQLLAALDAALITYQQPDTAPVTGHGGIILIEGEAGVGKTRLVQELARDAEWRGAQVFWGHNRDDGPPISFGPLREALQAGLSLLRIQQLALIVEPIWLQVLSRVIPPLATHLPGLGSPTTIEPTQERNRLLEAFAQCLLGWGQINPLLLILEDLHQVDGDTMATLHYLAPRLRSSGVIIVCTYRGEDLRLHAELWQQLQSLDRSCVQQRIILNRLDSLATAALVRHCLHLPQAAPHFEHWLYHETSGNPLFVLETLQALCAEGVIAYDSDGRWATTLDTIPSKHPNLTVPALEQAITRRLKLLSLPLRQVLATLAVLGNFMESSFVAQLIGLSAHKVLAILSQLVRWRFLVETPQSYQFSHDNVRQVIYAQIPPTERTRLHRRVAALLKQRHPDALEALAFHYTQGAVWNRAVLTMIQVAQYANANFAYESAWAAYSQALDLIERSRLVAKPRYAAICFDIRIAQLQLADVLGKAVQPADLTALSQLAATLNDPTRQAAVLNQQALLALRSAQMEHARQLARAALDLAQEHCVLPQITTAMQTIADTWYFGGDYRQAALWFTQLEAVLLAQPSASRQISALYMRMVFTYCYLGDLERAIHCGHQMMEHAQRDNDAYLLACAHRTMSYIAGQQRNLATGMQHAQTGLHLVRDIGARREEANLLGDIGVMYIRKQHFGQAIAHYQQALNIFRQQHDLAMVVHVLSNLGEVYTRIGRSAEAQNVLSEGLELAEAMEMKGYAVYMLCIASHNHLQQGQLAQCQSLLQRADQLFTTLQGALFEEKELALAWGCFYWAQRQIDAAAIRFEQLAQVAEQLALPHVVALAQAHLALCIWRQGDLANALQRCTQAALELDSFVFTREPQLIYFYHSLLLRAAGQTAAADAALERAYAVVQTQKATLHDPAWQSDFVERVTLNREICSHYARMLAQQHNVQIQVRLAHQSAPTGRPLRPDEQVCVNWTITSPHDAAISDPARRRQQQLRRLLNEAQAQHATPTIGDLATALGVSEPTIRRDLVALRRAGYHPHTRGSRRSQSA